MQKPRKNIIFFHRLQGYLLYFSHFSCQVTVGIPQNHIFLHHSHNLLQCLRKTTIGATLGHDLLQNTPLGSSNQDLDVSISQVEPCNTTPQSVQRLLQLAWFSTTCVLSVGCLWRKLWKNTMLLMHLHLLEVMVMLLGMLVGENLYIDILHKRYWQNSIKWKVFLKQHQMEGIYVNYSHTVPHQSPFFFCFQHISAALICKFLLYVVFIKYTLSLLCI